jgi:uncharacterized protein DUF1206
LRATVSRDATVDPAGVGGPACLARGEVARRPLARRLQQTATVDISHRNWVETGARFGHLTKGIIYGLIGALALQVAIGSGGRVAGQQEAAQEVGRQPFGVFLLLAIAAGLFGYAAWRFVEGIKDTAHEGMAKRVLAIVSGVVNAGLAVAVLQMALGKDGSGSQSWVGKMLEQPFGGILLGLIGLGVIGAGLFQLYQAYTKRFLRNFKTNAMSPTERRWVTRAGQAGYGARGVVFPLVGIGMLQAAIDHDPGRTRGLREALLEIARSDHGQLLLGLVAVGLLAFGLFMVASARYRAIPT